MKKWLNVFGFLLCAYAASAQNNIEIIQDPRIDVYMQRYDVTFQQELIQEIYRVKLIDTYDRNKAYGTQSSFRQKFPYQTFLTHDGIKFQVKAGRFNTKAEAEDALIQIRRHFPSAFLLPPEPIEN